MKLDLRFTARPLEEVWCEIVVAFVFEGAVENGDCAFGIDAKTSGYLISLKKRGFCGRILGRERRECCLISLAFTRRGSCQR